ncbi:sensor histidine kinase [Paenibacillus aurantiacus]|uniref:histidine kinase n=1 Tax=Paenibacillus aurantiacus TaxID=1936118 RepID=A0ABV5KJ36_9BACL
MFFVWIALWVTAVLLIVSNRRSAAVRWLSLMSFCAGTGAFAAVMEGWIVAAAQTGMSAADEAMIRNVQRGCSWTSYYGLTYAFLCFAAAYNREALPQPIAKWLPLAALVPVGFMFTLPLAGELPVHYEILAIWALPYTAAGTLLLLRKRGMNPAERRAHLVVTAAVLPALLIAVTMNYVMPLFGVYRMWVYNVWPIAIAFAIFIVSLFNFGFLGVQLLIERRRMDHSLRAITSGTAMLNHAIKNDIGKIKLFSDKIERAAGSESNAELRDDIRVIASAAQHIEAMIRSVHDRTQELRLQTQRINLAELVRLQTASMAPALEGRIKMTAELDELAEADADPAQTLEAIGNVLNNAVEAMPAGGELHVCVRTAKRGSTIEVRDTGGGIDKQNLRKVVEPFYTTKSGKNMNFGLGLAYCYQLMNRQGGELRIESELGKGTSVMFHFPKIKKQR